MRGTIGRVFAVVGRVLGWSLLGAVCGLLLGIGIGLIHAPLHVTDYPLENEGYTPFVLVVIMPLECLAGLLIGAGVAVGVGTPSGRVKAFFFALGGAALGVALGWVLDRVFHVFLVDWRDGSALMTSLLLQAFGACGGLAFAASRRVVVLKPGLPGHHGEAVDD